MDKFWPESGFDDGATLQVCVKTLFASNVSLLAMDLEPLEERDVSDRLVAFSQAYTEIAESKSKSATIIFVFSTSDSLLLQKLVTGGTSLPLSMLVVPFIMTTRIHFSFATLASLPVSTGTGPLALTPVWSSTRPN
jgi:hypothetical protein